MQITKKQISKAQIELKVEISAEELKPYLEKTAKKISEETKIQGFRPGKAPYDIVAKEVGEMTIYQHSIDDVISKTLFEAINTELKGEEITGQPQINIDKLAPGNPLSYTAIVTLVPEITIGDWKNIKVEKKEVTVDPKEIDKVLDNLRQMRAEEKAKLGPLEQGDKVMVKFNVFVDGVPIEGGQADDYPLVIGEGRFIPGFEEQLIGLSKGEKKEFELRFPKDYHQASLADKLAKFKIEIKDTLKRELPKLDDEFAKALGGYESLAAVKAGIEQNLKDEETDRENQRQEIAMLDELVKVTEFSDVPESLIDSEAHKMVHELEHSIESQGLKFDDYLQHLKKTEEDLKKEMAPEAKKRIQTALITRQIAKDNKIMVDPTEVEAEIEKAKQMYQGNQEVIDNLESPAYKNYLQNNMMNRKVIEFLKREIIK